MADQSDVETALVGLISSALYPQGEADVSAIGAVCRVYRGWPSSAALAEDLGAGVVNVSVFPLPGQQRNTTRFPDQWISWMHRPRLNALVLRDAVTFSGVADAGQIVGLLVDGAPFRYVTVAGDTPNTVALALLDLVAPTRNALLLNGTLRFPSVGHLVARVVGQAEAVREVRRQLQAFRVSFWCPGPLLRDRVVALVDLSLAGRVFIELPDGSSARLRYVRTETVDTASDAALFRRDLIYDAEFATLLHECQPAMLFGDLRVNGGPDQIA